MVVIFDLIVQKNNCNDSKSTLLYILKNIDKINEMDIKINIIGYYDFQLKEDANLVKQLENEGISFFPTLITPHKSYIGKDDIIELFNLNFKKNKNSKNENTVQKQTKRDPFDIKSYQMDVLGDPDDKDKGEDEDGDFSKSAGQKLAQMRKKREESLKHFKGYKSQQKQEESPKKNKKVEFQSESEEEEVVVKKPKKQKSKKEVETQIDSSDDENRKDNILNSFDAINTGDIDDSMMRSYLENNN